MTKFSEATVPETTYCMQSKTNLSSWRTVRIHNNLLITDEPNILTFCSNHANHLLCSSRNWL